MNTKFSYNFVTDYTVHGGSSPSFFTKLEKMYNLMILATIILLPVVPIDFS